MELIRGAHNLRARHRGCVATIGNFDGVHRGHQSVLRRLTAAAREQDLPSTVVIFEPQPAEFFAAGSPPARLTRLREKCMLLSDCGIDRLLVMKFDEALAALPAVEFVDRILLEGLGIKGLIVGDDFKFGSDRRGDFEMLRKLSAVHHFTMERANSFLADDDRVSSTRIRAALREGAIDEAARMLGHRYFIAGRVGHGQRRGREMGFPTANINLHRRASPLSGIFAAEVRGLGPVPLPAVAYVGTRPIIEDNGWILEVHIFDYDKDCYGRHLEVAFVAKIRDDLPFVSFEALAAQIAVDCRRARDILSVDQVTG